MLEREADFERLAARNLCGPSLGVVGSAGLEGSHAQAICGDALGVPEKPVHGRWHGEMQPPWNLPGLSWSKSGRRGPDLPSILHLSSLPVMVGTQDLGLVLSQPHHLPVGATLDKLITFSQPRFSHLYTCTSTCC